MTRRSNTTTILILSLIMFICLVPKIRGCNILLLSGGGAYGAFEAGVISRLVENGTRWDYLTGVSAGSINSYFLSSLGYPANLTNILQESWSGIKSNNVYKIVPTDWLKSLATNAPLRQTLIDKTQELDITNLKIPMYLGTVSLNDGIFHQWYLDGNKSLSIVDLVMASSNIPIIFEPYLFGEEYWVDGGLLQNIIIEEPIIKCFEKGDYEINIDMITVNNPVSIVPAEKIKNWYLWDYVVRTIDILYQNMGDVELNCDKVQTDIYARRFRPQTKPYSFLDFSHGAELFEMGYQTTEYTRIKVC
jgi:predicted acylesterase/phospholipase RssA